MKLRWFAPVAVFTGAFAATPPNSATEYLRYLFGATDVKLEQVCWPNDDLWMLAGPRNEEGLAEIAKLDLKPAKNDVVWQPIGQGLCIFELREGKADARFTLDQVYFRQRQVALSFIFHALRHDQAELARVATNPAKVRFGKTKPARAGDLDVYQEIIAMLPVLRVSQPADDKRSKSVTFLLPLGREGFQLRLVKRERSWLADTEAGVDVPLEVFYEESKERRVIYLTK